jgi:bacteriorhodopsin
MVGAMTYYAQASNLGWSAVEQVDNVGNGVIRQIFYAKYINWVVAFPSLALAMGLISGVSWTTIVCNIAISWIWVISYLVAAFTPSSYKWGFFAFGTFSLLILAMSTINESREAAALLGIQRDYMVLSGWLNLLWLLYPIAFGLTDGGNRIGVTGGFIFFGVLDILTVPVLSFAVLFFARNWDYRKLSIAFSDARPSRESESEIKEAPQASSDIASTV